MKEETYFSVRMRASQNQPHEQGGKHISGGELVSTYNNMTSTVNVLLEKALSHSRGNPDYLQIQFERINEPIKQLKPLSIETNEVETLEIGQYLSKMFLEKIGVQTSIINKAYHYINEYTEINGALLVDIYTGEYLGAKQKKGVRVSRMDWLDQNFEKWVEITNLPNSSRVKEALALATKVSEHPATVAELCWSDDPEYITGYVASKKLGYQRITKMKEYGDERGCRIFFVDSKEIKDLDSYIHYLEKTPVIIGWGQENDAGLN